MSAVAETKNRILERLRTGKKNVTQLSAELGLSKATVSQHMQELREMGLIEEEDNRFFRSVKYFRIKESSAENVQTATSNAKYYKYIAALAIIAVVSVALLASQQARVAPVQGQNATSGGPLMQNSVTTSTAPIESINRTTASNTVAAHGGVPGITASCPLIDYGIKNVLLNVSGFGAYIVPEGFTDYVLGRGSRGTVAYSTTIDELRGIPASLPGFNDTSGWAHIYLLKVSNGTTALEIVNMSDVGVEVNFTSIDMHTYNNSRTYLVNARISAGSRAKESTYLLYLGPGLPMCGGEGIVLTVGGGPYNGTIPKVIA